MAEITQLLHRALEGNPQKDKLFTDLYQELRRLAHSRLKQAGNPGMLDTTGLVHEAYLRSLNSGELQAQDRGPFLAYAARVMRSVIIDLVRHSQAARRGGPVQLKVTLDTNIADSVSDAQDEVLKVNEALEILAKVDPQLARLVEMRYFAGLDERDIAAALGVSDRTLRRQWQKARMLLVAALE
jgi:RNA polymerase sigma factor (TIGR02999 family)